MGRPRVSSDRTLTCPSCGRTKVVIDYPSVPKQVFCSRKCCSFVNKPPDRAVDIHAQRFGLLTAVIPVYEDRKRLWRCRCDCGNEVAVSAGELNAGRRRACSRMCTEALLLRPARPVNSVRLIEDDLG